MKALSKISNIISLLSLLFITHMIPALCSTEPHVLYCENNTDSSSLTNTYGENLANLLDSLSKNTYLNNGFYATTSGSGNATVDGLALCRGDVTPQVCKSCVSNASNAIRSQCHHVEAFLWYDKCQVQYSLTKNDKYTGKYPESNNEEQSVANPAYFKKRVNDFMRSLSDKAAHDKHSKLMFATGKYSGGSKNETIYGMVQCTMDISKYDCNMCLSEALGDLDGCCGSRSGGTVFAPSCNVRFQLFQFFEGSANEILDRPQKRRNTMFLLVVACGVTIAISGFIVYYVVQRCRSKEVQADDHSSQQIMALHRTSASTRFAMMNESNILSSQDLPFMDVAILRAATENFSERHKLGQGGFGAVYKGVLPNEMEIAVKRLSWKSWQGIEEYKNEIILLVKLQHRNLVRLLSCGVEGDEKLLVYEYMPNKSLDKFIYDPEKRAQLGWDKRLDIINGIASGILYLHKDSRLNIIHRDLKPSNVLLDKDMLAKISDFGMARIFGDDHSRSNTKRVVGTYGYMAPEYAMGGQFSVKSDVFSFGVILLEIISGKRSSGFYLTEYAQTLVGYAWRLWNEGKEVEFIDPLLTDKCLASDIVRYIHIGLLCVQEDPEERPQMSSIVLLLGRESTVLPQPGQPAFSVGRDVLNTKSSSIDPFCNRITISNISPR